MSSQSGVVWLKFFIGKVELKLLKRNTYVLAYLSTTTAGLSLLRTRGGIISISKSPASQGQNINSHKTHKSHNMQNYKAKIKNISKTHSHIPQFQKIIYIFGIDWTGYRQSLFSLSINYMKCMRGLSKPSVICLGNPRPISKNRHWMKLNNLRVTNH